MEPRSVLAVAAHPSDLEYFAGAAVAGFTQRGATVSLVVCTDGSMGYGGEINLVAERRKETERAAETLGVGPAMLQDGIGTTFFLASRVDLGTFTDDLVWEAGLHWWQKTETTEFDILGQTTRTEARYRDLALTSGVNVGAAISCRARISTT